MNAPLHTDYLLRRISVDDDREAFHTLFNHFYAALCLYAKKFIEDTATREDIVQDVFLTVWEKRKYIDIHISAKSYLITSVKNMSLNHLRREGYSQEYISKALENQPVYTEHPDDLYTLRELQEILNKALEKLPEEYRIAFVMSRMEQKSTSEIASRLGVSVRTVERYRNRALQILQEELKDYLPISIILLLLGY